MPRSLRALLLVLLVFCLPTIPLACAHEEQFLGMDAAGGGGKGGAPSVSSTGGLGFDAAGGGTSSQACTGHCSPDGTSAIDCQGNTTTCQSNETCVLGDCMSCADAQTRKSSVGCEYQPVMMHVSDSIPPGCFAAFVVNSAAQNVHVQASFQGTSIDLSQFAKIPHGSGPALTYDAYDPSSGLPPGEVAILFLAGGGASMAVDCPVPSALPIPNAPEVAGTSRGWSFKVTTDLPVIAYQMMPYGGGVAAYTGASLLLPTSAWGTSYVAVEGYKPLVITGGMSFELPASMLITALEDGTSVSMLPSVDIEGGPGVPGTSAGVPISYSMSAGEVIQIVQAGELTGSPVQSNKPIGMFAAYPCADVPLTSGACDHLEQMIPPVQALGSEYAAVSYRQRSTVPEDPIWRLIGAVDGTTLTYDPPVGGPATVNRGDVVEFDTTTPFVVKSQDADHPFVLVTYMSGGTTTVPNGYGDPDFVRVTATAQYLTRYVFFTDPTYPETNLVVVRKKGPAGFADVTLDCAGNLGVWGPLGAGGAYEWTRIDLSRHDFAAQGNCDNGRHEMSSTEPFGLWVWGWGSPETSPDTSWVSYGYQAGEGAALVNNVVLPPIQ